MQNLFSLLSITQYNEIQRRTKLLGRKKYVDNLTSMQNRSVKVCRSILYEVLMNFGPDYVAVNVKKMRQYLIAVFILLLGYNISPILSENKDNDGSSSFSIDSLDDSSSKLIDYNPEYEHDVYGDVLYDKKTGKRAHVEYTNEDDLPIVVSEDKVSEENLPMDDVAYWESIYGTEYGPDFEIPPHIDGETIFIDLAELEDQEAEEEVQVKRDIHKILVNRHGESTESYWRPKNSDYRDVMTSVYQPHIHDQNFARNSKTSFPSEEYKDGQFDGSDDYSQKVFSPDIELREKSIPRSEPHDAAKIAASHEMNIEMEDDTSPGQHHPALESRSIKSSGIIDSLIDAKRKVIPATQRKIELKKELVDSIISSKTNAIQEKKEFINSFAAGIDHSNDYSANTKIQSSGKTQSSIRTQSGSTKSSVHESVLDSKRKVIQTKKEDLIQEATSGDSQTKLTNAIMRVHDAKRKQTESGISDGERTIYDEKELGHTIEKLSGDNSLNVKYQNDENTEYNNHKKIGFISTNLRYQNPFQSVRDSKRRVIQAKKDFIHTAATGGSKAELTHAVIKTLNAKKDLIDSVVSSKADIVHNKKQLGHSNRFSKKTATVAESEVQSSLNNHHRSDGTYPQCQKCAKISTNLHSGSTNAAQSKHESVINLKSTKIQSSKSAHHSSVIGSSNVVVTGEIGTTNELRHIDNDKGISSSTKKKVKIDSKISGNLDSSLFTHRSGVDSSHSAGTVDDSDEIKYSNEMRVIHHTKSSLDSTASETALEDEIGETISLSNGNEEQDISSNMNKEIQTCGQIFTDLEPGISTGIITIDNSEPDLLISQSEVDDYSSNSDQINLYEVIEEGTRFASVEDSESSNASSEEVIGVASYSSEGNQEEEEEEGINESTTEIETAIITSEEHIDTKLENDDLQSENAECTPEKCGISGKLRVVLDSTDKNENLREKLASETLTELKVIDNCGGHQEDEKIVNVEIQPTVTKNFDEKVTQSDVNEKEEAFEDIQNYNEKITKTDEQSVIIHDQQTQTVTATKNIDISSDTEISGKTEEIHQDKLEEDDSYHNEWQGMKKFSLLKNLSQFSHSTNLHENSECYGGSGTLSNIGHCRLINLDVDCSSDTAFMNPECQQLNTHLWHPQDSNAAITLRTIKTYLSHGQEKALEMHNRAKWLCDKGYSPKHHTPSMLHLINNLATEDTIEINQASAFSLFGTKMLQNTLLSDYDVTPNSFLEFLKHNSFRVIGTGRCHVRQKRCPGDQIYRPFDGLCNNRYNPTWGRVNTAFSRILPARYSDGIHELRKSVTGKELPNPRVLSVHCFSQRSIDDNKLTLANVQWAQLTSHDFGMQLPDQTDKGGVLCCANKERQLPKRLQHHSCLPIDIPWNDTFYSKFGARCMEFVRSMTAPREDCTLGPAEQLNTVTGYLDCSMLYGSNKKTCNQLRSFKGGKMLVSLRRGRELLPIITNRSRFCDVMSPNEVCYHAGDRRANQTPQLAILHTVLLREHNRIADKLSELNPHWDDERLFQATRRVVLAEYESITYNEWLPLILGKKYCEKYKVTPQWNGDQVSQDYDPRIKASTINEFTTGAYRFFHSMVQGIIDLCPMNRDITHTLRLSNHYFRPHIIERNNNFDDLIRGLVTQPMQQSDNNFHPEITGYLFRSKNPYGFDLLTFDILRGRDHGIPCYNCYREICGIKRAKDFDDLQPEIPLASIEKLKTIYLHVDDIDLFVGIGLEKKCRNSIFGPVGRCLIGEQFYRSRVGDRYFHTNAHQPYPFTQEQLKEIRKASLAKLLCNTADDLENIQPHAFKVISRSNPLKSCCDLPDIDLSLWQELKYD